MKTQKYDLLVGTVAQIDPLETLHNMEGARVLAASIDPDYEKREAQFVKMLEKIPAKIAPGLDELIERRLLSHGHEEFLIGMAYGLRVAGFSPGEIAGALATMFPPDIREPEEQTD